MKKCRSWGEGVRTEYKAPEYLLDNLFNLCDTGDLQKVVPGLSLLTQPWRGDLPDATVMLLLSHLELLSFRLSISTT